MKRSIRLWTLLAVIGIPAKCLAGNYVLQGTFPVSATTVNGLDSDSVGNLYLLGFPSGAASASVYGYSTPGISPVFTFSVGVTSPGAFAVEASGVVDVLDMSSLTLKRFQNNGAFIGQTAYSLPYIQILATAIDKVNQRVYLSYTFNVYCVMSIGSTCNGGVHGVVNQYDFQGNYLKGIAMPGSSAAGGCYTPSVLAVDPQGNVAVADAQCSHVLKFSSAGNLMGNVASTNWSYGFSPRSMWTDSASNIYVSQSICTNYSNCQPGVVKLDGGLNLITSFYADSATGLAWDNRIAYIGSNSTGLRRFIYDNPPGVAVESGPLGSISQHSSSAQLSWQPSSDPDGDPITYSAYLGTASNQLFFIGSTTGTSWTTPTLSFGTAYYWQIVAGDSYLGLPLQTQVSPVVGFTPSFVNNPPGSFSATGGMGTAVTRNTSLTLNWQTSVDPDGDAVTYDFYWRTASQTTPSLIGSTAVNSWTLTGLSFGTTYYWSIIARDPYGATTPISGGEQSYYLVFKNSPPPAPPVLSGTGSLAEHTLTPQATLAWSTVSDPDGDPVAYQLFLGTNPNGLSKVQDGASTTYNLTGISFGTTYYWQVAAYDPYGGVSASGVQNLVANLQNSPPAAFGILTGAGTTSTRNTSQLLSWQNAIDPDGDIVTYDLSVSTVQGTTAVVQSSTATNFNLSFQFGTTYYWQVTARDGFGGATASGPQAFTPVFLNSPPTVPANQSKTGTVLYHGFSPSQSFFWQSSTDPDGDPFTYNLYFGTDSANMSVTHSVPLGYTLSNLPLNTGYYFKIVATDIYGASSNSPLEWVYFQFSNSPPQAFGVVSGTGTYATRDTTAALSWTPAGDPDGDAVTYRVFYGTSPSALAPLGDTAQPGFALKNLAFGTTYFWRVDAYDGYGGTTTINGGTQSLLHIFQDAPPSPIVYLTTASVFGLHTTSPTVHLAWSPSSNTYGDPISYSVQIQTSTGNWLSAIGSSTSLTANISFGTTYYWRVIASDPYGAASTGTWLSFLPVFQNNPPGLFSVLTGSGTLSARTTSQLLSWQPAVDLDGDPVTYSLSLSTNPAALSLVQISTQTGYPLAFQYGTTYYWHVDAYDIFGATTSITGGVQTFIGNFLNDPPSPPQLAASFIGSPIINTMATKVIVSWNPVTNPQNDPIGYTVYLGESSDNLQVLTQINQANQKGTLTVTAQSAASQPQSQVQMNGNTIQLTLTNLNFYRTYYFRVSAATPYGASSATPVQTFSLTPLSGFPKAYNYPNPFNPNHGGTNIVFNAPPSGYSRATVSIYSELQDLLFQKDYANIPPGISQVQFDGKDRYGRAFYNGSYICRVRFQGPDDKETFYLLVVK